MTTLAEKLRAWVEPSRAARKAEEALGPINDGKAAYIIGVGDAELYLRGHDDAKAESAGAIAVLREEGKRLTARVRELEAQPAAVGVVVDDEMRSRVRHCQPQLSEQEIDRLLRHALTFAQIVPLASGDAVGEVFHDHIDFTGTMGIPRKLYPGIAQPAQEREG
jgi:hypothetical protein